WWDERFVGWAEQGRQVRSDSGFSTAGRIDALRRPGPRHETPRSDPGTLSHADRHSGHSHRRHRPLRLQGSGASGEAESRIRPSARLAGNGAALRSGPERRSERRRPREQEPFADQAAASERADWYFADATRAADGRSATEHDAAGDRDEGAAGAAANRH